MCIVILSISVFTNLQFSFREVVATSHTIINILHFLYDNLVIGDLVLWIFLDLRKTFDCVDDETLLSKLSMYGIRSFALD